MEDIYGNPITNPDLTKGWVEKAYKNEKETVEVYFEYSEEQLADRSLQIKIRKQLLTDTDYVVMKIAEGVASREEYADILEKRRIWRDEINELEKEENQNGVEENNQTA